MQIVVGKLQQVKENALCWSLKTYLFGDVVHLARVTICIPTLQRCVALKIVVANRPVLYRLKTVKGAATIFFLLSPSCGSLERAGVGGGGEDIKKSE